MTAIARIRAIASGPRNPVAVLTLLSLLFAVAWFALINIGFHCDSPAYIEFAQALFGGSLSHLILWVRTAGYPLLIALGGAVGPNASFHSFLGILFIQAAMGVAMPALTYKAIEPYSRPLAFLTGLFMIFSLQPYITSKLIMTEQSFKFFSVLLLYLAVKAYWSPKPHWWIAAISATCILLALLRPAAILMAIIVFGGLAISRLKLWKPLAVGFASICASMFIYSFVASLFLPPPTFYSRGQLSRLTDLEFYDLYMQDNASALDPDRGPRRRRLHDIVEHFAAEIPLAWLPRLPKRLFAAYKNDPKGWVDNLYSNPDRIKYQMLKDAVSIYRDQGPNFALKRDANRIIQRTIREAYLHEPWRLAGMILRYGLAFPGGGGPQIMFNKVFSEEKTAKFTPDNGPASRDFVDSVRQFLADNPNEARRIAPPPRYRDYTHDPDGFVREQLIGIPNPDLFYSIWDILVNVKDPYRAHKLYDAVDREGFTNGAPDGAWSVYKIYISDGLQQLNRFFFGTYFDFDFFYNIVMCYNNPAYVHELLSGTRLFSWVKFQPDRPIVYGRAWSSVQSKPDYVIQSIWMFTHLGCNLFIFYGALFALWSRYRWPILVTGALILSHAIPSCFIIWGQPRYVDQILPLTIILTAFVAGGLLDVIRWGHGRYLAAFKSSTP